MIYHYKENSKEILSIIISLYKLIIYKNEIRFKKRIFLLKSFYEFVRVQRAYCAKFNEKISPNTSTIRNIVSVFEKIGSVSPTPPKHKSPSKKRVDAKNELKPW